MKSLMLACVALVLAGCDEAKEPYEHCLELERTGRYSKLEEAIDLCEKAVTLDPNSVSGKAANAKLTELKGVWREAQQHSVPADDLLPPRAFNR